MGLTSSFANVTAGWSVQSDQSSGVKASDLQVAKANSGSPSIAFTMVHKMGLLLATIPAASEADNVITYDGNTYNGSASGEKWTRINASCTTISWNASTTFTSSTNKPFKSGSTLYYIAKPSDNTISISASSGTQLYAWSVSGASTTISGANTYKTFTIATPDYSNAFNKKIWQFDYSSTKSAKTWVAPHTGTYSMEVWGAQGGNYSSSGYTAYGGYGAYVSGNISLTSGNTFYAYVGEQPTGYQGGWNGGGTNTANLPAGGGGATDISVRNGTWNSETHLYSRIIVAGGGGGGGMEVASKAWGGGAGGAWIGGDGKGDDPGKGGGLNAAGSNGGALMDPTPASFGTGGSGGWGASSPSEPLGGGGGGWYGGGCAGGGNSNGGGGGGSSYVWTTDGSMHTYYPASSYKPSTSYYLSSIVATAGTRSGHGMAKITYNKP